MNVVKLESQTDFGGWRDAARRLLAARVAPQDVDWIVGGGEALFGSADAADLPPPKTTLRVPAAFLRLAERALLNHEPARFALLYRLLWRLREERRLLEVASDVDVARVRHLAAAVDRDIHKMHAFLRFRAAGEGDARVQVAWFEPAHFIVAAAAPFFVRRFAAMRWSILTPDASAHWDGTALHLGPGVERSAAPDSDALETLWRTYYASIFNPARLKVSAMQGHMPKRYWPNLPEATLIPDLVREAAQRTQGMIESESAAPRRRIRPFATTGPAPVPYGTLESVRAAAVRCRDCPLWEHATQTVFGAGPSNARVMLVGEQPGDEEDLAGRPFVGPSGALLDRALAACGISRDDLYLTNAVKHFKFEPRGRRRLHRTPGQLEIEACGAWLERELAHVRPALVVALGATASLALTGRSARVEDVRGRVLPWRDGTDLLVTAHPASVLRADTAAQDAQYRRLLADLELAAPYTRQAV